MSIRLILDEITACKVHEFPVSVGLMQDNPASQVVENNVAVSQSSIVSICAHPTEKGGMVGRWRKLVDKTTAMIKDSFFGELILVIVAIFFCGKECADGGCDCGSCDCGDCCCD